MSGHRHFSEPRQTGVSLEITVLGYRAGRIKERSDAAPAI